jgi:hypothetical protein
VIVIGAPAEPEDGERLVIPGVTLKFRLPLTPFTVTTTEALPRPKLAGTLTAMLVSLQLAGVRLTPPKVTVLEP